MEKKILLLLVLGSCSTTENAIYYDTLLYLSNDITSISNEIYIKTFNIIENELDSVLIYDLNIILKDDNDTIELIADAIHAFKNKELLEINYKIISNSFNTDMSIATDNKNYFNDLYFAVVKYSISYKDSIICKSFIYDFQTNPPSASSIN